MSKICRIYEQYHKVFLVAKNPDGTKNIVESDYQWYMHVDKDDLPKLLDLFRSKGIRASIKSSVNFPNLVTVYVPYKAYKNLRDTMKQMKLNLYEAGIRPVDKFYIDNQYDIDYDNQRVAAFDIETDDSIPNGLTIGAARILSIGIYDGKNEIFICENTEAATLEKFNAFLDRYDLLVGWNSKEFDVPYIEARARINNVHINFGKAAFIDLMSLFLFSTFNLSEFSLEAVSQHFLKRGKVKHDESIKELYDKNREKLREYNIQDCKLVWDLDAQVRLVDLCITKNRIAGRSIEDTSVSYILQTIILKYARKKGVIFKDNHETSAVDFRGAIVLDPIPGKFKNVVYLDFTSLYPSVMMTWNISPETKNFEGKGAKSLLDGISFDTAKRGIFAEVEDILLSERAKFKKLMQTDPRYTNSESAMKELANSLYGICGMIYSFFYDVHIAESITLAGRFCLLMAKHYFEKRGYKIIAGDTDSVFLVLGETPTDVPTLLQEFNVWLGELVKYKFGCVDSRLSIKYEETFPVFINIAKKNYAGLNSKNEIKGKGLEFIKKDIIPIAKKLQKMFIADLFRNDHPLQYYVDKLKEFRDKFYSEKIPVDQLTVKVKLSKLPSEYKNKPPHVRFAERSVDPNSLVGTMIAYVVKDEAKDDLISADEYDGTFDRQYYFERKILNPTARILKAVFNEFDPDQFLIHKAKTRKSKKPKIQQEEMI